MVEQQLVTSTEQSKRILVTWFEPFGTRTFNASYEAAYGALSQARSDTQVIMLMLPVVYEDCWSVLKRVLEKEHFDAVVAFGEGGLEVTVETLGRNVYDLERSDNLDNLDNRPTAATIEDNGPEVVKSTLPSERVAEMLQKAGIACHVGSDAGTFCCNEVLYQMSAAVDLVEMSGFIHVPAVQPKDTAGREVVQLVGKTVLNTVVDILRSEPL